MRCGEGIVGVKIAYGVERIIVRSREGFVEGK